jgi:hypothetical protein
MATIAFHAGIYDYDGDYGEEDYYEDGDHGEEEEEHNDLFAAGDPSLEDLI